MEKRVIITIALCIAVLVGWVAIERLFFPPGPPAPTPPPTAQAPAPPSAPTVPPAAPQQPPAAPQQPSAAAQQPPAAAQQGRPPEQRVTVQREGLYRAVFSSYGGSPVEFTLLNPQYKV